MSTAIWTGQPEVRSAAEATLEAAVRFWFAVTVIGQWAFLYYILAFYGTSTLQGHFELWRRNRFLFRGYVTGDTAGNLTFAAHALLAAVIAFGGTIQFIPQLRRRAIAVHRWNGRMFVVTAIAASISGLAMVWFRGATSGLTSAVAISINAALIVTFAVRAWRSAVSRDLEAHRRWALRLFLAANAQWFIRLGFVTWAMFGPGHLADFIRVWNFGCYLFPLAMLELYLRVDDSGSPSARVAMAGGLAASTLAMGAGIFGLTMFLSRQILVRM
jgi:hypothetical protein